MKKLIILCSFIVLNMGVLAQEAKDSLWTIWENNAEPDTTRLAAINKLIWDYFLFSNPDSAGKLAQQQYDMAEAANLKKSMVQALNSKGISFAIRQQDSIAMLLYEQSLNIAEQIADSTMIANNIVNIGMLYGRNGDVIAALKNYEKGLAINISLGNKDSQARCLVNIGTIYHMQGDMVRALDYYNRSLKIYSEQSNKRVQSSILTNVGTIYTEMKAFEKALENYEQSLEIMEEIDYKSGIGTNYANIGNCYVKTGDYERAMENFQKSLEVEEEIGNLQGYALTLEKMAFCLQAQGRYQEAESYLNESLSIMNEIEDEYNAGSIYVLIGQNYQLLKDYSNAIINCKTGYEICGKLANIIRQRDACICLYESYLEKKDYKNALKYNTQVLSLSDSLKSDKTADELQAMEFENRLLADSLEQAKIRHSLEMAYQQEVEKKKRSQGILFGSGILFLLVIGGLFYRNQLITRSRKQIQKEKERSDELLLNILPYDVAEELKNTGSSEARDYDNVTVLFTDFQGFTKAASQLTAKELVAEINYYFKEFDEIITKNNLEKIKTIGDAYMAAGGLQVPIASKPEDVVIAALQMQAAIKKRAIEQTRNGVPYFEMRVGIHTGPVVAGIVGVKKFQYDIWGDTVNIANRMETSGAIGKVNISQATYEYINDVERFTFESRGELDVKGKGKMKMWFVSLSNE